MVCLPAVLCRCEGWRPSSGLGPILALRGCPAARGRVFALTGVPCLRLAATGGQEAPRPGRGRAGRGDWRSWGGRRLLSVLSGSSEMLQGVCALGAVWNIPMA